MQKKTNMRVLVIAGGFPTAKKPDELVFVYNQVCQLAKYEDITMIIPVPVFLFSRRGIYIKERKKLVTPKNLKFKVYFTCFYIPFGRFGTHFYAYSQILSVLLTVLFRRIKIDIIHGHFLYPEGFVAVLLGKLLNKPVINTAHGSDLLVYTTKKSRVSDRIRFAIRQSDKLICVANALKEKAVYFGINPGKIKVISNGIDTEVFSILPTEIARKTTGLDLNAKVVLFIGHLIEPKGVHILLESISQVVSSIKAPVLFLILGEGNFEKQLRRRVIELGVERHVQFIGTKENKEIPIWINSADLICLPSFTEGLPCVLIESLACGVPVVATCVGGVAEIIQQEDLGLLVSPGDAKELAEAIVTALKKNWDRKKIREYAIAQYNWKLISKRILNEYHKLRCCGNLLNRTQICVDKQDKQ